VRPLVGDVDVYHAGEGAFPRRGGTPIVGMVHDLTSRLFPKDHTILNRFHDRRRLHWLTSAADCVFTNSEATRQDLLRLYPALGARTRVTLLATGLDVALSPAVVAARREALRHAFGPGSARYVLTVGTLEPRKNHVRLIRAFAEVAATRPDVHLVLAGRPGWKHHAILREVVESPVCGRIHVLGAVSAEDLAALYGGATAFAYPSQYEGFGLPVLEAMSAGVPVLTSNVSSLPEVAGDAALLVSPNDPRGIAAALAALLDDADLRDDLAARGRRRARDFDWQRTARETLAAYRELVRSTPGGSPTLTP
jgi:glycosyltransferase involved in cell wall biosynthesis